MQRFKEWLVVRVDGCNNLHWQEIINNVVNTEDDNKVEEVDASEVNNKHAIEVLDQLFQEFTSDLQKNSLKIRNSRYALG